jgi:hypothetical protein
MMHVMVSGTSRIRHRQAEGDIAFMAWADVYEQFKHEVQGKRGGWDEGTVVHTARRP